MPSGPETKLTNRIRKAILAAFPDAWIVKVAGNPYQTGGIPDLLVLIDGLLFGIEVKAQRAGESEAHARGRVTERQQATIDAIIAAGGAAFCTLGVEETIETIREALLQMRFLP